jgi:hypothetical protein
LFYLIHIKSISNRLGYVKHYFQKIKYFGEGLMAMMALVDWHGNREQILTNVGPINCIDWVDKWAEELREHGRQARVEVQGKQCRLIVDRLA